jgi:Uma2 family endonuclease
LIEGEILQMTPQRSGHAIAIQLVEEVLRHAFGGGYNVRTQLPLALDLRSEPEPDIAVVVGVPRDYRDAHPSSAVLIVEVADASLDYDRERKGNLYAQAEIIDYWIINLIDRRLEVYRDPDPTMLGPGGNHYRTTRHYSAGQKVAPLAVPQAEIAIEDLLP